MHFTDLMCFYGANRCIYVLRSFRVGVQTLFSELKKSIEFYNLERKVAPKTELCLFDKLMQLTQKQGLV